MHHFKLLDLILQLCPFICLDQRIFLLLQGGVCLRKQRFDLLFIGVADRLLHLIILLVFRVQMEDDLCELGYLFAHLVMGLLANR
jgi:hypothetical protein